MKLARKIGGNPVLAQFELEIMPGAAVEDGKLADVIASNLPWPPDRDGADGRSPRTRGRSAARMAPRRGSTHFVPLTLRSCRSLQGWRRAHHDLLAERIAKPVYAMDGTLGGVPVLGIAAPGGRGRWLAQSPEPGDRRSP